MVRHAPLKRIYVEQAKHDAIIQAAMECFIEQGFKKSSIDEIAERANVGKGTVYLACESKADLFYRAVHADLQAWAAQIARFVDPRQSAEQILRKMAETGVIYIADHPLVRGLFAGVHQGMLPDWAERFAELRAMGRSTVADVLRLGIRQGEFRSDLDIDAVSAVLQDFTHSGYVLYGDAWAEDPSLATTRIQTMRDMVFRGLRSELASSPNNADTSH